MNILKSQHYISSYSKRIERNQRIKYRTHYTLDDILSLCKKMEGIN